MFEIDGSMRTTFELQITDWIEKLIQTHESGSNYHIALNVDAFKKYLIQSKDLNINIQFIDDGFTKTGSLTKLRVIHHCPVKQMNAMSINQGIDKEKCKKPTLLNLKDHVKLLIKANISSLRDLKMPLDKWI